MSYEEWTAREALSVIYELLEPMLPDETALEAQLWIQDRLRRFHPTQVVS